MSPLQFDDLVGIRSKLDEKAGNLFKARPGYPQLQVIRYCREPEQNIKKQDLFEASEIMALAANESESQIFFIRQDRSWTTLNCGRELFESFVEKHRVFPQLWKTMFIFGRKTQENELEFPGFRARRIPISQSNIDEIYESTYMLRRVELHRRDLVEGQSPWSIRQTGIYHRLAVSPLSLDSDRPQPKSMFLLIAPSKNVDHQLGRCDEMDSTLAPWSMQRLLVADSLNNWTEYMAYLEEQLREQSDRSVVANVGMKRENLSPLTEFDIKFADRQILKTLEDSVFDLQIIFSTTLKSITRLRSHCKNICGKLNLSTDEIQDLEVILDEFDEYAGEAEMHVERGKALNDKARSTAKLLSDLLSYEEAVALKDLTSETQQESKAMMSLTERSTKDAAAMKVLTIITLIYLPTSIVFNFFSTEFVATTDQGRMIISNNVWLLAVISIPLTFFTIALWATWVYFAKITATVIVKIRDARLKIRRKNTQTLLL